MSWEDTFQTWSQAPSKTEEEKAENAESAIKAAIDASDKLSQRGIRVFAQGSYKNRTNVRLDSDVDISVVCTDVCFTSLSDDLSQDDVGLPDSSYTYDVYKNEVEDALISRFGAAAVTRGNKAFDVHENTYRVEADVVACFEHRRYIGKPGDYDYHSGTELRSDDSDRRIINWPEQNYKNGVMKNKNTNKRFKSMVRVLKRLRNELVDEGIISEKESPGYLIECLVWNVPNQVFGQSTYKADVRGALAHLFNNTIKYEDCKEWGEINELKYLFRDGQKWAREEAHRFTSEAWDYIGFN